MIPVSLSRAAAGLALIPAAVLGLSSCAASIAFPAPPKIEQAATEQLNATGDWGQITSLALQGDRLFLGTSSGLWEYSPVHIPQLIGSPDYAIIALTQSHNGLLSSGYSRSSTKIKAPAGLRLSTGARWAPVALDSKLAFKTLAASGDLILGVTDTNSILLASADQGATWTSLGHSYLTGLTINPLNPKLILGVSPSGPALSRDGGKSFKVLASSPDIATASWGEGSILALDYTGTVYRTDDLGENWVVVGTADGMPSLMTSSGHRVAVVAEGKLLESTDGGRTFNVILRGLDNSTH